MRRYRQATPRCTIIEGAAQLERANRQAIREPDAAGGNILTLEPNDPRRLGVEVRP